jgi:hypothetical protein
LFSLITHLIAGDKPAAISTAHTTAATVADALADAWVTANSDANLTNWTVDSTTAAGTLTFTARDAGTSQIGAALTFVHSVASETQSNLGYEIYNAYDGSQQGAGGNAIAADNIARGVGIVLTVTADTAGTSLSEIGNVGDASGALAARAIQVTTPGTGAVAAVELGNSYRNNTTLTTKTNEASATNVYPAESRSDVAFAEDAIAGSSNTATSFDRTGWLAD